MSYQVLARKWRPANFRQMVGQEHVLQALINALDHDRLHHAYLFTGTRGVGKTTVARIFAKCLNCEQGVSSEPCGECSACLEVAEGRSVDLIEVDAASRTKVEDTRELLENVQYAPTSARYKVYLIDEVHMLSSHSFNALLKTLEEPPPHVKFLLATTDPQKLPATILSRCLQFNLKNMPPEQVVSHLKHVLDAEMVEFDEPALWLLGRAAAGSMRDALSLTDQAIAFGSGKLREDQVRTMLGSVDMSFVYDLLAAVIDGDPAQVLAAVDRMAEHAPDYESSLEELISLLHRLALAQAVPEAIDNSWGDASRVAELAAACSAEDAQLFYQIAINGKRDMPYASDSRSGLEMTLLRMVAFRPEVVIDPDWDVGAAPAGGQGDAAVKKPQPAPPEPALQAAPEAKTPADPPQRAPSASSAEKADGTNAAAGLAQLKALTEDDRPAQRPAMPQSSEPSATAPPVPAPPAEPEAAQPEPETAPESAPSTPADEAPLALEQLQARDWHRLVTKLGLNGIVDTIASHSALVSVDGNTLQFVLEESESALYSDARREELEAAMGRYFDRSLSVLVDIGQAPSETPAGRTLRLRRERQDQAVRSIESDPVLQRLIERFDGELDRESIAPL